MNAKSFSRFTILAVAFALVFALGVNTAKAVPGLNEITNQSNEAGSVLIGSDQADNAAGTHLDTDAGEHFSFDNYGLSGTSQQ